MALQFTFKSILRQKKNYGKLEIFHHAKNILIFKKSLLKKNQNPSRYYYNFVTNLKFQHKPKKYHLSKNPHIIKIDLLLLLLLLPRGL